LLVGYWLEKIGAVHLHPGGQPVRKSQIVVACLLISVFSLGSMMGSGSASAVEPSGPALEKGPGWIQNPEGYLEEQKLSPEHYEVAVGSAMARGPNKRFARKMAELEAKKQLAVQLQPKDVERSPDGRSSIISTTLRGVRTLATWQSAKGEFYVLVVGPRKPAEEP
jgi:hypothetical protein